MGIGKELFEQSRNYCKEVKVGKLELNVWTFNKNAIRFNRKLRMKEKFVRFELDI